MSVPTPADPNPPPPWWRHRACWLWVLTPLVAGLLWYPETRTVASRVWLGINALLLGVMFLWALWHPIVLFKVRGSILRWAFWPALIIAFSKAPGGEPGFLENSAIWLPAGPSYLISLLGIFPIILVVGLVIGVIGAGGGILASGSDFDRVASARSGIRWLWFTVLMVWLFDLIPPHHAGPLLSMGIPWGFTCLHPFIARGKRRALMGRLDLWLARRLRWSIVGHTLDLRAEVFACAGFLIAWSLVSLKVFLPFQSSAMLSSIQILNATGLKEAPKAGKIVLLEWDSAVLRAATTQESEAAVQAKLILRFAQLGARRVVLPMPAETSAPNVSANQESPVPIALAADFERTARDISALEIAMRAAGNVVLLAPDANVAKSGNFTRLLAVASEVASPKLRWFQNPALPAIPFRWPENEPPPAPLTLFGAQHDHERPAAPVISADGTATFDGKSFPLIDRKSSLLVDLGGSQGGRDFAHVTYSEVLRGEWQFSPGTALESGAWVPPDVYFKNKIVFLPPLREALVPGPLGALGSTELLAHATRTLSEETFLRNASRESVIGWALFCALAVGRLAMRREPLKAGWRLVLVIATTLTVSLVLFGMGVWLDPVLPAASALASFLLVTQLSFSLERAAKERNRFLLHRFVDPEIAGELLQSQRSRLGLGGDRENVVILFADVRGFSRFAEDHPPEEVMRVVNAYLGVMTDALHARGGLLDKYTGDGLMAMFRLERSGTVTGAVETALAMRDASLQLSRELKAGGEASLRVGISLHVGEAVVGLVGNADRQVNFTALGHTVVVASRLQSLTAGGEVVVSREIHDAVDGNFEMELRPEVHVKGISQPVQPYVVIGRG